MKIRKATQSLTIAGTLPRRLCSLDKLCRLYRKNRRGVSVVEFAMVAPVFFLLVFGMIEYGRMVMVQQVLTNATREGARRAVLDGSATTEVKKVVNDYLKSSSIKGAKVAVSPDPPSTADAGAPITVSISVPYKSVSWLPAPFFLGGKTMQAQSVMRRETVQ